MKRKAGIGSSTLTDPQLAASQFDIGAVYEVTARSMLLFERVPEKGPLGPEVERTIALDSRNGAVAFALRPQGDDRFRS